MIELILAIQGHEHGQGALSDDHVGEANPFVPDILIVLLVQSLLQS